MRRRKPYLPRRDVDISDINGGLGRRYDDICLQIVVRTLFRLGNLDADHPDLDAIKNWTIGFRNALKWPCDLDMDDTNAMRVAMQALKKVMRSGRLNFPTDGILHANIEQISHLLGLNQDARDLVHLLVIIQQHDFMGRLLCDVGQVNLTGAIRYLSSLTGMDLEVIEDLIAESGSPLRETIVEVADDISVLPAKVRLARWLGYRIRRKSVAPTDILSGQISEPERTQLTPEDFPHLKGDLSVITNYLAGARQARRSGINILLYGPPGTGKTEFAKLLADQCGARLLEECGSDMTRAPKERFRLILVAQKMLARSEDSIVLIDEADDLIRAMSVPGEHGTTLSRMSLIRLLEQTPTPCIWITNHHRAFEPALLRRFDYVLEMKAPPRSVRSQVVERYLGELLLPTGWKEQLLSQDNITPANLERAARVASLASPTLGSNVKTGAAAVRALNNTLKAMGGRTLRAAADDSVKYRPEVINSDIDLAQLTSSLGHGGNARLCLYGPPGTGKTAYARYLARTLDRSLHVRRASDLLSRWVGGTEENIAEAFASASEDDAILLIDEADTFLRDRSRAERSWEVSQVNELLVQLETFTGMFIASTNMIGDLDRASLRRFDFKVAFMPLKPEQIRLLMDDMARQYGLEIDARVNASITSMMGLTPGDFANVARQARFVPVQSGVELYRRLTDELLARNETGQRIGFL